MTDDYRRHEERLRAAQRACASREAWVPFEESPSESRHQVGAKEAGHAAFEAHLGRRFELGGFEADAWTGEEVSPYTMESLGVTYPRSSPQRLFEQAVAGSGAWAAAGRRVRVGVCMEILDRLAAQTFENAFATMHTSGQAFMMAFAGSGANSLDRGLEAIAFADLAMSSVPSEAMYERRFGRGDPVQLHKRYRLLPRGVALVVTCGSYPAWNAYPSMFANLATGNPVVVKPHPGGVLPMAIAVQTGRRVLAERGFDPNLLTLAVDTAAAPITKRLMEQPRCAIVDFTGGQEFGAWIERNFAGLTYTETSGCNAVVVESTNDLDGMLRALAQGIALFSGQMCTSPQNIFVPRQGVESDRGHLTSEEFTEELVRAVDSLVDAAPVAAAVCGALQQESTLRRVDSLTRVTEDSSVLRSAASYAHPDFPSARTCTPLLLRAEAASTSYRREHFGPIAFVIECEDREHALRRATEDAAEHGSIANYAYTVDDAFLDRTLDAFANAGASVGCNLIRQRPINFTAAFSDYHVTGLNPAGNACLTDISFVASRFRIVQSKVEVPK